jgi:hypothetical protein
MPDEVLSYGPGGTAHFNVLAAAKLYEQELAERRAAAGLPSSEREFRAAMQDLERLGMTLDLDPDTATPRAQVRPAANVPGGIPGLQGMGDLHTQVTSPGERYWERWRGERAVPVQRPVAAPKAEVPLPPEAEKYRAILMECCGPILRKLQCGPLFTQPMTWLAPPVTAICVDVFTAAAGVITPGAYPGPGDCVDVLAIDVPDRWIFVLDSFGNELEDHTAWGDVRMSMQRNRTPLRCYGNFDVQLGRFVLPTEFGSPILLKHKDQFRLKAQSLGATQHTVFARIKGWAFAVRSITGDGEYNEFCVQ